MNDPRRDLDADPEALDDVTGPDGNPFFPAVHPYEPGLLGDGPFLPDDEDEEEAIDALVRNLDRRGLRSIRMRGR